jgi:outer membrane lipoprotein-sorting protein
VKYNKLVLFLLLFGGFFVLSAQDIITAERYLSIVGERYGSIRDYEARIDIRSGNSTMRGTVSHLSPSLLRIDFSDPQDQVIVFNGEMLTIYLPEYRAALNQSINTPGRRAGPSGGASLATSQGLALLRRNYIPAFVTGPDPVPLESGSSEQVIKIRLTRRSVSEGFREILLDINPETYLIRRIEGRTIADSVVRFDFANISINQGIPEQRFVYDSPASANVYNDFLFRDAD